MQSAPFSHYDVTYEEYEVIKAQINSHIEALEGEADQDLMERTERRLKELFQHVRGTTIQARVNRYMKGIVQAKDADDKIREIWETYQVESRERKNAALAAAQVYVPSASVPIPHAQEAPNPSPTGSYLYGSQQSQQSPMVFGRAFPPPIHGNYGTPDSAEFYTNAGGPPASPAVGYGPYHSPVHSVPPNSLDSSYSASRGRRRSSRAGHQNQPQAMPGAGPQGPFTQPAYLAGQGYFQQPGYQGGNPYRGANSAGGSPSWGPYYQ